MTLSPGGDARAGDAVQGHRERLGQRGVARREALGQAQDAGRPAQDVLGEGAVGVLAGHAVAVLALRGLALQAAPAGAAARAGTADDELADRPVGDVVADGGDGAAPLVAGDDAGREAPAVAQLVDVGPADAARVRRATTTWSGPGPRDRALLHRDDAGRLVDGGRHDLGERARPDDPDMGVRLGALAAARRGHRPGGAGRPASPRLRGSGRARCRRCGRGRPRTLQARGNPQSGTRPPGTDMSTWPSARRRRTRASGRRSAKR